MAARRLLFVSHSAGRTGAPIGLLAFMQWLRANSDFEVATLLRGPGPLEADFAELGPTVSLGRNVWARTRLGRRIRARLPRAVREEHARIRRLVRSQPFDLIYANTATNGLVFDAIAPIRIPVVTHVHELGYWIERTGPENLRSVLAHSSTFIAASEFVRQYLVRDLRVAADKLHVVYEHIRALPDLKPDGQAAALRERLGIPAAAYLVGSCGAEHWRKGRDLIPQLLVALRREAPDRQFHFLWVGRPGTPEEETALRHDLQTAGVTGHFHSTGEVADPFAYYDAMDAFALLSRDDPFPLACLEAAAMEKPVVCFTGAGGMPEFVAHGCGVAVPYLDVDAMARVLIALAADAPQAKAFGRSGRRRVAQGHLPSVTGPQLLALVRQALNQPSTPA